MNTECKKDIDANVLYYTIIDFHGGEYRVILTPYS